VALLTRQWSRFYRRLRRHRRTSTPADLPALNIAYRAGIVASGDHLGKLPVIDSRGFDEQGIHYVWRSFVSER